MDIRFYTLALLSLLLFGRCGEHDSQIPEQCGLADPAQDLPWLKDEIAFLEENSHGLRQYSSISMGTYKGQAVFINGNCCPFCNYVILVRDCDGDVLFYGNDEQFADIKNIKIIWQPVDFSCQL
jgi:hypothetical protein